MGYADNYANNVSQILMQRGNAQAQARLQSGQGWATALNQIGQTVAGIPGQLQQQQLAEQQRALRGMQAANYQSEAEARDAKARADKDESERRRAVLTIGAALSDGDPNATQAALQQVKPEYRAAVEAYLSEHQQRKITDLKSQAKLVQGMGYDPQAAEVLAAMGGKSYLDRFHQATENGKNPAALKQMVDAVAMIGEKAETPKFGTAAPGAQIFNESTGQTVGAPIPKDTPAKTPTFKEVMIGGKPTMAAWDDATQTWKPTNAAPIPPQGPKDDRIVQIMGPDGVPVWTRESDAVGKPAAQAPRAVTGAERQALSFYNRGRDAVETITTPDEKGVTLEDRVAKSGYATQLGLKYLPNVMKSDDQQAYTQAQRAFTEARLRKESGAAIPPSEFENDRQTYFAQPGDSPATVDQKRQKRAKLLEGLGYSAGKAYDEFYGEPLQKLVTTPPPDQSGTWKWNGKAWVKK